MRSPGTIRLATRGSALARRQAASVRDALEDRRYDVELVEVSTRGDEIRDELIHRLGHTGAFVRALDEAVLDGDVDAAVHSMKDMPTESPDDLIVAGIPTRGAAGDLLVTPGGATLEELPSGAAVGTASVRRGAQLRAVRPDLTVTPIRGNVDTRLEKLLAPSLQREHEARLEAADDEDADAFDRDVDAWFDALEEIERRALGRRVDEELDAVVLAAAGLERAGLRRQVHAVDLPLDRFVPAPGQGAIAVTSVDGSDASEVIHDAVDDPRTRVETTVERSILAALGGGCVAPIGVHAVVQGDRVHTSVQVLDAAGDETVTATRDLPIQSYLDAAGSFAEDLRDRGAATLIEAAVEEADDAPRRGGE